MISAIMSAPVSERIQACVRLDTSVPSINTSPTPRASAYSKVYIFLFFLNCYLVSDLIREITFIIEVSGLFPSPHACEAPTIKNGYHDLMVVFILYTYLVQKATEAG